MIRLAKPSFDFKSVGDDSSSYVSIYYSCRRKCIHFFIAKFAVLSIILLRVKNATSLNWFGGSQSLLIAYRWKTKETNWYCWYCNDSKFTMSSMVGLRIYILHNLFIKGKGQKKVWLYHRPRRFAMRSCNQPVKVASWCSSDYSKIKANK